MPAAVTAAPDGTDDTDAIDGTGAAGGLAAPGRPDDQCES
jgi:hypothetical protein